MIELGELEKNHEEFAKRGIRIFAVSNDDEAIAKRTQTDFPHLVLISDTEQNIAKAMQVIDAEKGPQQTDTNAPTTFLVDGTGNVRWVYRPARITDRLAPGELLNAIDETLPTAR
jgi:peroxiredoxin